MYVGVDGHKRGWIAIVLDDDGFAEARTFSAFAPLREAFADARVLGVDIPLGLLDTSPRSADQAARAFLQGNASSVFNAPVRAVLDAGDYTEAKRSSIDACGKALSRQTWNLVPKIREVDAFVDDERILEVHPEVSFRQLQAGRLAHTKKTWGGLQARLALLATAGIELPASLGADADAVGIDDVVDAAVAAWSARRCAHGEAVSFPARVTEQDASGRGIAIWA